MPAPPRSAFLTVLRNRPLLLALGGVWLFALLPIWLVRFLPLLDFPNHLGAMAVLHRWHDPSWNYAPFYELHLGPFPYWGHYYPVDLMAYVLPLEVANKIWISAYALALPLGVAVLAEQLGRSPWLALLAAPFVFSFCFALGFLSFVGGAALFAWALWALEAFMETPTVGRAIGLVLWSCALYLMHVMPWLLFGLAAGVILLSHGWRPKRMAAAAGCMAFSVALALGGMVAHRQMTGPPPRVATVHGKAPRSARFEAVKAASAALPKRWLDNIPGGTSQTLLIVLALSWLGLLVSSTRGSGPVGRTVRYDLFLGAAALLYFALPQSLYRPVGWWYIAGRMTVFFAIVAALTPRGPIDLRHGWRRFLLLPPLVVSLAFPLLLLRGWLKYEHRAAGFARLMERVPRGSSTLVLMLGHTDDPDVDRGSVPFLEFHALAQVLGGGFDPWAQATPLGGFPMAARRAAMLPAPYFSRPREFDMTRQGVYYDYILTRNEPMSYGVVPQDQRAELLEVDGTFRLYRVVAHLPLPPGGIPLSQEMYEQREP